MYSRLLLFIIFAFISASAEGTGVRRAYAGGGGEGHPADGGVPLIELSRAVCC